MTDPRSSLYRPAGSLADGVWSVVLTPESAGWRFSGMRLADLDMDKRINLDALISRTYKFDEINEGFKLLTSGQVARGVIVF